MNWVDDCIKWDMVRNNLEYVHKNEADMIEDELIEFIDARSSDNELEELADIVKVAISAMWKKGYDPNIVMQEKLKVINSRQQDPQQKEIWDKWGAYGKWLKDGNQPEETKYKADYSKAKYEV